MILFLKTSQAYSGGYPCGTKATLIDDEGTVIGVQRGGGYNMEYALLKPWAEERYKHLIDFKCHPLPDGGSLRDIQNVLGYHGVTLVEVKSPIKNLYVYEVRE
jgi:hypothetical protein